MSESHQDELSKEEEQEIADLRWVMSSEMGRRFVYRLVASSNVFRSSFNIEALQMAFNEGRRNNGLRVLSDVIEHCYESYEKMMKENQHNG